jgi:hypothetical protein
VRVATFDDAGIDELMQMANEHALGDLRDAPTRSAHRAVDKPPQNGALPAPVGDGHRGVDWLRVMILVALLVLLVVAVA